MVKLRSERKWNRETNGQPLHALDTFVLQRIARALLTLALLRNTCVNHLLPAAFCCLRAALAPLLVVSGVAFAFQPIL